MIKVKFLKSHPDFGYFAGDMGMISPEAAEKLLKGGYVLPLPGEEPASQMPQPNAKPVNTLPEDLPEREKLFDAGFTNIQDIKSAGDNLLDVPGISNAKLKKISKYLEKFVFAS